jgi:hypothetical protein
VTRGCPSRSVLKIPGYKHQFACSGSISAPPRFQSYLGDNLSDTGGAFAALSGDIGVLDIQQIRLFIFIESLARDAEATANKREDKTPPHERLAEIRKRCVTLRESRALLVRQLEGQLINYYKSPAFGRLPHPFENPDTGGNPPKEPVQNS